MWRTDNTFLYLNVLMVMSERHGKESMCTSTFPMALWEHRLEAFCLFLNGRERLREVVF